MIKIFADAASNLYNEFLKEKQSSIKVMNIKLTVGERMVNCYDDDFDINEVSSYFYEEMRKDTPVGTSQITPSEYINYFETEVKKGNDVICFTMAKGISGTYNSACLAAEEVNQKYSHNKVVIIDSMTAGFGEGLLALHAEQLVKQGKTLEEIVKDCEEYKYFERSEFTVGDVKYLIKTGRLNKTFGKFLGKLNIQVLLKNTLESNIGFALAVVGRKMAIKRLAKMVIDKIDRKLDQIVYITHCNCLDDANKLKEYLIAEKINNIEVRPYDIISGSHIGPDSLAIFYVAKEKAK